MTESHIFCKNYAAGWKLMLQRVEKKCGNGDAYYCSADAVVKKKNPSATSFKSRCYDSVK